MILDKYPQSPSPNISSRGGHHAEVITFHYTAGAHARGDVSWLCNPASGRSAHFDVGRDGTVWQLAPLGKKAWHAGQSEMVVPSLGETLSDANRFTIGIEFSNHGYLEHGDDGRFYYYIGGARYLYSKDAHPIKAALRFDTGHTVSGYWEPFPGVQIEAAIELVGDIREATDVDMPIVGHEDIAMPLGKKTDPGPLFPWEAFDRKGAPRRASSILMEPRRVET